MLQAYAAATGVRPLPHLLELFRVRWDLADTAVDVSRFMRPHHGAAEDDASWRNLSLVIERISA